MEKIFCISGLGADDSVFKNVSVKGATLHHLSWPQHDAGDDMQSYALKLANTISEPEPILLGLSFGGMLAVEIAKIKPVKKAIIVSSAKTFTEIPKFGKFVRAIVTSEIVPAFFYKIPNSYLFNLFGATTNDEKQMLTQILKKSNGQFMRWAMKAVTLWHNTSYPSQVVHIHGTADKIIPAATVKPNYWIEGGSHIMLYNKAAEINKLIEKELTPWR